MKTLNFRRFPGRSTCANRCGQVPGLRERGQATTTDRPDRSCDAVLQGVDKAPPWRIRIHPDRSGGDFYPQAARLWTVRISMRDSVGAVANNGGSTQSSHGPIRAHLSGDCAPVAVPSSCAQTTRIRTPRARVEGSTSARSRLPLERVWIRPAHHADSGTHRLGACAALSRRCVHAPLPDAPRMRENVCTCPLGA